MRICLLAESVKNPVLVNAIAGLGERHTVVVCDPQNHTDRSDSSYPTRSSVADLYLLKSRTIAARSIARDAEQAGAVVINSPAATTAALDRQTSARLLARGNVPAPRMFAYTTLRQMAAQHTAPWPCVVKSRISRRGDLVTLVQDREQLSTLLMDWGDEPVIAQQFIPNEGYDIKVWVIGDQIWAARRACALGSKDKSSDVPLDPAELPAGWMRSALRAGRILGLDLFGVDLVCDDGRAAVIDVNAFPGFQGIPAAADSLVDFVDNISVERRMSA